MREITGPAKYGKLIIAIIGAVASTIVSLGLTSGHLTSVNIVSLAIAAVAALQVWYVTETRANPSGKAIIAGLAAALVAAQTVLTNTTHIPNLSEWMQILIAGLTAAGVLVTPGNLGSVFGRSRFKTAQTGARIEITSDGFAKYDGAQ